ncbi:hypothetical protein F3Y22_tig00110627pilonHSYRG00097 [Hibiscus syriacus]|uniref:ABC transmembrane type-1 domain-containing protein n=1 Tax=Hibiscus syriacus TaxID=106335 RepID=A0A6A3A074_HIBSY|nr:hypothetical protein F3Y22_tig00110627pilonHSYRG00097 [Hibiscus syriacus]
MTIENSFYGDSGLNEASVSKSCLVPQKDGGMNRGDRNLETPEGDEKTNKVPFLKLFAFADPTDILLMIAGTTGAIGNGISMPLMTILFGELTDSFGQNQNNNEVVALNFVYLGVGDVVSGFLQVTCWMVTGERQAARIRSLYLKTIHRLDIAFFDLETNSGEVVGRMSGGREGIMILILCVSVGKFLQLISMFIGGFVVAFIRGWLLTLVMLSSLPLLVIAGAAVSLIVANTASQGQNAYAKSAAVVKQAIGSIRTVTSFTGEKQAMSDYDKFLVSAYRSGVYQGFVSGIGLGLIMLVVFCSYALAVWFGGRMILENGYTGGEVVSVIVAIIILLEEGSFSHFPYIIQVPREGISLCECICFWSSSSI